LYNLFESVFHAERAVAARPAYGELELGMARLSARAKASLVRLAVRMLGIGAFRHNRQMAELPKTAVDRRFLRKGKVSENEEACQALETHSMALP
jgi:hypothetical protein